MTRPSILLLYNQPVLPLDHPEANSEHDILETAEDTYQILRDAGLAVQKLGIHYDPQPLLDTLRHNKPDAVFNLFEGLATQTGTEVSVAALLEWLNVPFTGCPSASLTFGRDKVRTKHLLAAAGIPTPNYMVIESLPAPPWPGHWPVIVKPVFQDASVGIDQESVVTSPRQLTERTAYLLERFGPPVLIEEFIFGREFHVNIIEERTSSSGRRPRVLPVTEVVFLGDDKALWPVYTFTAKWHEHSEEFAKSDIRTAITLPPQLQAQLEPIAHKAYHTLQCRDYARLDVRLDTNGQFYILEVNPNPYLNSITLVDGLKAIGRSHEWWVVEMALAALERGGIVVPEGVVRVPPSAAPV
ncbi:MAG: hypothetical protein RMJ56_03635 [Gemmataceae bacterium]|nr:hypothetical protein [Gemmata sp.]MDW8196680.1 hypothetical protein [Gemmataceae bacterium]